MKLRTPQNFILEMGIDANAGPAPDGTYSLIRCLARYDSSKRPAVWVPAWDTEFQPEDRIVFRVFDYTAGATVSSSLDLKVFEVHFVDPQNPNTLKSPFSPVNPILDNPIAIGPGSLFRGIHGIQSAATDARIGWICSDGSKQKNPPFLPGEIAFTFSRSKTGRFLFRLQVKVTYDQGGDTFELRAYGHDPEIFVGEGDPGPPPR